jgi:hypothetical protein
MNDDGDLRCKMRMHHPARGIVDEGDERAALASAFEPVVGGCRRSAPLPPPEPVGDEAGVGSRAAHGRPATAPLRSSSRARSPWRRSSLRRPPSGPPPHRAPGATPPGARALCHSFRSAPSEPPHRPDADIFILPRADITILLLQSNLFILHSRSDSVIINRNVGKE